MNFRVDPRTGFTPSAYLPGGPAPLPHLQGAGLTPLPHLHQDWAHPCHICTGTAHPGPHLHQDWARPRPHLYQDWACPCHICNGARLAPSTSAPGLGCIHCRIRAKPDHICAGTGRPLPILLVRRSERRGIRPSCVRASGAGCETQRHGACCTCCVCVCSRTKGCLLAARPASLVRR